jgi:hypothetical protein
VLGAPGIGKSSIFRAGHIMTARMRAACSRSSKRAGRLTAAYAATVAHADHERPAAWHGLHQAFADEDVDGPAYRADRQPGLAGQLGQRWELRDDLAGLDPLAQPCRELQVRVLKRGLVDLHGQIIARLTIVRHGYSLGVRSLPLLRPAAGLNAPGSKLREGILRGFRNGSAVELRSQRG